MQTASQIECHSTRFQHFDTCTYKLTQRQNKKKNNHEMANQKKKEKISEKHVKSKETESHSPQIRNAAHSI